MGAQFAVIFRTLDPGCGDLPPYPACGCCPSYEVETAEEEMKMLSLRAAAVAFALAGLSAGTITTATAGAAAATTAPAVPTLIQVSAAYHYGHDQLVFQFRGGVPAKYSARYV